MKLYQITATGLSFIQSHVWLSAIGLWMSVWTVPDGEQNEMDRILILYYSSSTYDFHTTICILQ